VFDQVVSFNFAFEENLFLYQGGLGKSTRRGGLGWHL
jgi:hypothetical protein